MLKDMAVQSIHIYYQLEAPYDMVKSKELCLESSTNGNKLAEAFKYLQGWETENNKEKAMQILTDILSEKEYTFSSKEEKSCSYILLASIYESGEKTIKKDLYKALEYFERAIELDGNYYAIFSVALLHQNSEIEELKDFKRAVEYYSRIENKYTAYLSYIFFNLAQIYQFGQEDLVEKDIHKAIECYEISVEMDNHESILQLALIYHQGDLYGLQIDVNKAIHYYQKGVLLDNVDCIYNFAHVYHFGDGGFKIDIDKAIEIYSLGAKLNDTYCFEALADIYSEDLNHLDFEKAAHFLFSSYNIKKDEDSFLKFVEFIEENKVNWKEEYHIHWQSFHDLNSQIVTLFLISKFRKQSKFKKILEPLLVKGITKKIIKFLCHVNHIKVKRIKIN